MVALFKERRCAGGGEVSMVLYVQGHGGVWGDGCGGWMGGNHELYDFKENGGCPGIALGGPSMLRCNPPSAGVHA